MQPICIDYRFDWGGGRVKSFTLELDAERLEPVTPFNALKPDWARLECHQCPHCPLKASQHPHCPVALSLVNAVVLFNDVRSYDELYLTVTTDERQVSQRATAQRALSSLLGLLIATSGCPHTHFLKPMARFHLPLATDEETVFRAVGSYLIAQYLIKDVGGDSDQELKGLRQIYDNLHELNTYIVARIRQATGQDSTVNAVIVLDMFTNLMPFVIDDHLDDIRPLFDAYLSRK